MIKLVEVRKSMNAQAQVAESGWNLTSDGREYYIAIFADANNPFAGHKTRVISQQFDSEQNAVWKGGDPKSIKAYIGKEMAGSFIKAKVEPYEINDRTVDTYTAVVLGHENVETVFRNAGHSIVDTATGEVYNTVKPVLAVTESL